MQQFELKDQEYIELNKLLKIVNWASSGGEANQLIVSSCIVVNSVVAFDQRKKIRVAHKNQFEELNLELI